MPLCKNEGVLTAQFSSNWVPSAPCYGADFRMVLPINGRGLLRQRLQWSPIGGFIVASSVSDKVVIRAE